MYCHSPPSGWTYGHQRNQSLIVLVDKETETLWFPMEREERSGLVGIAGSLKDHFPKKQDDLERTTWRCWIERFPNTTFVRDR